MPSVFVTPAGAWNRNPKLPAPDVVMFPLLKVRVPPFCRTAPGDVLPVVLTVTPLAVIDEPAPVASKPLADVPDVVTVVPVRVTAPALSACTPVALAPLVPIVVASAAIELPPPLASRP